MIFMNAKCAGGHSHRDALALLMFYDGRELLTDTGMTSFNHYAYGCIGEWMYRKLCGIRTAKPGYRESILVPKPIAPLSWAEASLETPYGQLSCRWEKKDGELHIAVTVPCNTTATLILPYSGKEIPLGSGSYEFTDCMR